MWSRFEWGRKRKCIFHVRRIFIRKIIEISEGNIARYDKTDSASFARKIFSQPMNFWYLKKKYFDACQDEKIFSCFLNRQKQSPSYSSMGSTSSLEILFKGYLILFVVIAGLMIIFAGIGLFVIRNVTLNKEIKRNNFLVIISVSLSLSSLILHLWENNFFLNTVHIANVILENKFGSTVRIV